MSSLGLSPTSLAATAILVASFAWIYTVLNSHVAKLPGPWYTKWTDVVLKYNALKGRRPAYVHALHLKYGPVVRISPQETSLADPSATQRIYRIKGEFLKADMYSKIAPGLTNIFITRDASTHKRYRRLLSNGISESALATHLPIIENKVRLTLQRMSEEMQRRGAADVFHWYMCMATDVIGELSFGESFRMLDTGEKNEYLEDLQSTAFASGLRVTLPFLTSMARFIPIPFISQAVAVRERMSRYADESLQRHYRIVEEEGEDIKPTLLSKLYKAGESYKSGEEGMLFNEIQSNAVAYIIAGSDTTSNTLTYLTWLVCKHPDVKNKLLDELNTLPDGFGYREVKSLPYLGQVIEETLRLYPAAPSGLPRSVPKEGAELAGHYIPAGYTVSSQAYSMHRNPTVYPEPLNFDPSRWEKPTQSIKDSFVAFGGGSRICLGLHLARMELRLAAALFFHTFPNATVSVLEGFSDEDMDPKMFFLLSPKNNRCLIEVS
ncbi:cytochrome P450 [Xylariales sp. AK1849]|nr:cytochrome P450 [Xylariales sp. AK1849]